MKSSGNSTPASREAYESHTHPLATALLLACERACVRMLTENLSQSAQHTILHSGHNHTHTRSARNKTPFIFKHVLACARAHARERARFAHGVKDIGNRTAAAVSQRRCRHHHHHPSSSHAYHTHTHKLVRSVASWIRSCSVCVICCVCLLILRPTARHTHTRARTRAHICASVCVCARVCV